MDARLGIDVGGTFTDLVAISEGKLVTAKVPSTPQDQSQGAMNALRTSEVEAGAVVALAHGMTVATNALLERRGARTAIVTTEGFRDVLEIARQNRPSLYDLSMDRPPPLVPRELRFVVKERMGPEGEMEPLDEESLEAVISDVKEARVEAVAVCLLFAFAHPEHERRVGEALREALPELYVSLSSEVLPEFREYERFSTTTADAYLAPRLAAYLKNLQDKVEEAGAPAPLIMQSSGGVLPINDAIAGAAGCLLSGPAGGVVGAAHVGSLGGYHDLLTFDMGGTSTDVAPVVDGEAQTTTETVVAGVPIKLPMVDIHTVSAGGGSIAWADAGGALRVGPHSAGADPGPAAYDMGGEQPTVTDANLYLGYLADGATLGGEVVLKRDLSERALETLGEKLGLGAEEVALGIVRVANAEMARALRVISVERGLDPREFALLAFGGAGGMHACDLAGEMGMETVLVPRAGGVLSALGLAISDLRRDHVRPYLASLEEVDSGEFESGFEEMEAAEDLEWPECTRRADLRYRGQSFELTVEAGALEELEARFHAAHEQRYGYKMEDEPVELVNLRLIATVPVEKPELSEPEPEGEAETGRREANFGGEWTEAPVLDRERMGEGSEVTGPAIVEFKESTCAVHSGWRGRVDGVGTLVLGSGESRKVNTSAYSLRTGERMSENGRLDPVTLSVLASALSGVAEEMGAVLIRGAYSSNIKERRDCSTALFDGEGRMVAQAEHIPVHLGAMPEAVAAVMRREPEPGDVFAINDPYSGGTHLPDITLVSPVAYEENILGYAVTRAHHSDVGGMRPGSMPSDSTEIYQEGIVIPPVRLVRGGEYVSDVLDLLLANVRTPALRRGDLRAQIAANRLAETRVGELIERRGKDVVLAAFEEVITYTEKRTREAVKDLPDGEHAAEDHMEGDGATDEDILIKATVKVEGDSMTVDFSGTADAVRGNVNCPLPVTRSACYFALRVLLPKDIPANAGTYAPLTIEAPEGSLVNALYPSAVVAGNVETSNRIADIVLAALSGFAPGEIPAQGQGTMNNTIIGGRGWTYYETVGGGQGASARGPGPSGVHVGMSNTLNTPVEALELEFPMRVERYELRYGSGGAGKHRGGDGIVRSVRVLEAASLSLLTDRRRHAPRGMEGGEDGAVGENLLNEEELPAKVGRELEEGDVITVKTPGGGGYGEE